MKNAELIARLRSFEADHKPDGWPAIQMRDVSALLDAIEALEAEVERLKVLYESSTAAHEETVGRAMRAEAQLAAAQGQPVQVNAMLVEALKLAVRQNGHDMLMTGEELRKCEKALIAAQQAQPESEVPKLFLTAGFFPDACKFDADGSPSFYTKESADKFAAGKLDVPCKGKNCGSLNGWMHSVECRAEHEAACATHQDGIKQGGQHD